MKNNDTLNLWFKSLTFTQNILIAQNIRLNMKDDLQIFQF